MAEAVSSRPLLIRLLGPFDVQVGGKALPPLRTRKGAHLLALLALRQPREVQREWLATNLWPDSDIENAYYNLRRSLTDLRSALGSARDCLLAPTPHSLCLSADNRVEVDVARFDALVKKGDTASLEAAVDLYRGPLLEGYPEDWIVAEREFRHQSCLKALDTLASQAAERQDWSEAMRWLKRIVVLEPFQEEGQRRLIEALAQQGDYAAAALAYREYRERLRAEMNALPSPETTSLFQQIQAQAGQHGPVPKSSAIQKEPEGFTGYLPRPLTSFVGRSHELEEVQSLLYSSRLVTVLGPGGIGKTRLALRVAERTAADFPEGVWFVDLASTLEPFLLAQALARALKLREEPGQPILKILLDFLNSQHLLLILDNCEHLREACGQLAEQLLAFCPALRLLATSRQPLGIEQEITWQVPPLTLPLKRKLPPAGEGLAFVLPQYEAARLFAERAAEAMPAFNLTEQNASATLRIVTRLDGLPLAIELAAARVRALSVEQVAARLDNRFRLLTRGAVGAQPRQQTLRATIDWSYDLLSDAEAALLRRLSVFAGGWTLDAAEQICGVQEDAIDNPNASTPEHLNTEDVLDVLTDLIEKSLVVADLEVEGERRYRMLESIREYGLEKLRESGEEAEIRARHAWWFLKLAVESNPQLYGSDQALWLDRLEADHDNLHAVLEWGFLKQSDPTHITIDPVPGLDGQRVGPLEAGMRMAGHLWLYWQGRGYYLEADRWLEIALQVGETASIRARAMVLVQASNLAQLQNRLEVAKSRLLEALALKREIGNPREVAIVLTNLGIVSAFQNDYTPAYAYNEEAITILRGLDDKVRLAFPLLHQGALLHEIGDYERALAYHEESLALRREVGNARGTALTLSGLAQVHIDLGDYEKARSCLLESLQIRQQIEDRFGLIECVETVAILEAAVEAWESAARLFGAADRLQKEIGVSMNRQRTDRSMVLRIRQTQEALGEQAFTLAWQEGSALTLEEAVMEVSRMLDLSLA